MCLFLRLDYKQKILCQLSRLIGTCPLNQYLIDKPGDFNEENNILYLDHSHAVWYTNNCSAANNRKMDRRRG